MCWYSTSGRCDQEYVKGVQRDSFVDIRNVVKAAESEEFERIGAPKSSHSKSSRKGVLASACGQVVYIYRKRRRDEGCGEKM